MPVFEHAYPKYKIGFDTNTLIKTTVRNKYLFVLDFIVHYYNMFLYTFYLKMATDRGRNML
jgi:hypothetical protein